MTAQTDQRLRGNIMPKGFYDLSERPKALSQKTYLKILAVQEFLIEQNKYLEYWRKFDPIQYEKLKELAAKLQTIIRQYWDFDANSSAAPY